MNRYIINLVMLLLVSITSNVCMAEDKVEQTGQEVKALVELESANDAVPTDEDRALAEAAAAKKKAESQNLMVSVDRAWGLLLGDELTVIADTSTLESGINESSLPQEGKRYGLWLYLKSIDVTDQRLVFHYQVINVPAKNTSVETPTFDIKQNDEHWLVIPAMPLMIGPSLAASEGLSNIEIKEDIAPTIISITEVTSDLKRYSLIAIISWLLLMAWHFGWKTKNRAPFSQAVHDLGRLKWKRSATPDQASRILHTAFNQTSNTIVVYGEIDKLLENYPWLAPLQEDIKAFYHQSEQHFFARQSGQEPDMDMIKKLAKACRSKEMLA
ncbi:MAG: hypothetical protein PSN44_07575 [Gammaproteobacteria bacterium]|nr:hypothetical protein [Gammaproteobacteria bacterium]